MKQIPCSNPTCSDRRVHHERPFEKRPHVMIEVSDDWDGKPYMFCSYECACYSGKFHIRHGWIHDQPGKTHLDSWFDKNITPV